MIIFDFRCQRLENQIMMNSTIPFLALLILLGCSSQSGDPQPDPAIPCKITQIEVLQDNIEVDLKSSVDVTASISCENGNLTPNVSVQAKIGDSSSSQSAITLVDTTNSDQHTFILTFPATSNAQGDLQATFKVYGRNTSNLSDLVVFSVLTDGKSTEFSDSIKVKVTDPSYNDGTIPRQVKNLKAVPANLDCNGGILLSWDVEMSDTQILDFFVLDRDQDYHSYDNPSVGYNKGETHIEYLDSTVKIIDLQKETLIPHVYRITPINTYEGDLGAVGPESTLSINFGNQASAGFENCLSNYFQTFNVSGSGSGKLVIENKTNSSKTVSQEVSGAESSVVVSAHPNDVLEIKLRASSGSKLTAFSSDLGDSSDNLKCLSTTSKNKVCEKWKLKVKKSGNFTVVFDSKAPDALSVTDLNVINIADSSATLTGTAHSSTSFQYYVKYWPKNLKTEKLETEKTTIDLNSTATSAALEVPLKDLAPATNYQAQFLIAPAPCDSGGNQCQYVASKKISFKTQKSSSPLSPDSLKLYKKTSSQFISIKDHLVKAKSKKSVTIKGEFYGRDQKGNRKKMKNRPITVNVVDSSNSNSISLKAAGSDNWVSAGTLELVSDRHGIFKFNFRIEDPISDSNYQINVTAAGNDSETISNFFDIEVKKNRSQDK